MLKGGLFAISLWGQFFLEGTKFPNQEDRYVYACTTFQYADLLAMSPLAPARGCRSRRTPHAVQARRPCINSIHATRT
jgi:hypothetical protein